MDYQTFNLHTHTMRCGHASGLDEQYIESGIASGFQVLGFSEHLPFEEIRIAGARMVCEDAKEYLETMRKHQANYQDRIKLLVGYEAEYLSDHVEYLKEVRASCDYLILGQHFKYLIYDYDSFCSDEDVIFYAHQIEEALATGLFTYVAHPDYVMMGRRSFSEACAKAAHLIAQASLTYDVPLEINLNGFSYGSKPYLQQDGSWKQQAPYPFYEFWQIISSYGCNVVFGYDAHSPLTLLERNREMNARELLSDLPLNFVDFSSLTM